MLLDDWAAIPVLHPVRFLLVSPRTQGFSLTPIGVPFIHLIRLEDD
jgi:hypothetical protein